MSWELEMLQKVFVIRVQSILVKKMFIKWGYLIWEDIEYPCRDIDGDCQNDRKIRDVK